MLLVAGSWFRSTPNSVYMSSAVCTVQLPGVKPAFTISAPVNGVMSDWFICAQILKWELEIFTKFYCGVCYRGTAADVSRNHGSPVNDIKDIVFTTHYDNMNYSIN
jgi:hypothetical protein